MIGVAYADVPGAALNKLWYFHFLVTVFAEISLLPRYFVLKVIEGLFKSSVVDATSNSWNPTAVSYTHLRAHET